MQISDLVQLQGAARTAPSAQAPTADAGRPQPSSGAEPAAGEGFGSQLRRAIERQASAAAEDTAAERRPESAGKADELDGLEALDASVSDVDPGTPEGVLVGGPQAQSTAGGPVMAEGLEVSQVTGGGQRVRMSPPVASQVPAGSVEPMPSTTDVLRAAAVRAAPSVAPGPVGGNFSTAAGEAEGLQASAQSPAIARWPANLESRLITEPPVRVPASGAGRVGAPVEAEVGVVQARVQATPVRVSASSAAPVALQARPPFGVPSQTSPPVVTPGGMPALAPEHGAQRLASHVTVNVDSPQPQRAEQFLEARRVSDVSVATEAGRSVIDASGPLTAAVLRSLPSQPSPGLEAVPAPPAGGQMPLRTTTLGPAVDLLVGEEPEPDLAALLSYARDSGLGAQALKKLFGGEVPATASLASAATSASAALASPVTSLPAGPVAALPASPGPQAGDPAVMSMAVWIGGRAGASTAGGRSLNVVAPPVRPVAFMSEPVDAASAPLIRAGGFEATSSGAAAASPASALPTSAAPPVAVSPSMVTVPGVAAPVSHADLALRLARATATRMVAELRQGNGSLRLQIEPASLGKVDIDMTLRQGALEATLVAHQSVTRELLADGLPRLRDTLMQLGMNVAGVDVKSGFNSQSDGKSTNQQNKEIWYSSRRGTAVESTLPMDGGDQRRSSRLDLWA